MESESFYNIYRLLTTVFVSARLLSTSKRKVIELREETSYAGSVKILHEKHEAEVITVLNLKGGVGKTHTTWLLAGVCSERGKRCLCVDLDTQGNLTRNLMDRGGVSDGEPVGVKMAGVEALFDPSADADVSELIRPSRLSSVDLIPASGALGPFDLADQRDWEAGDLQRSLVDALEPVRGEYEYVFCDCPPRLSLVSFSALVCSHHVIIPLEAADWGAQGVTQVAAAVEYVRERENSRLNLLGYLVSRFKTARSYQHAYLAKLRETFGEKAFDTVVVDLAEFEKSVTHAEPVTGRRPKSREAEIARRLFEEVERRIAKSGDRRAGSRRADVRHRRSVAV